MPVAFGGGDRLPRTGVEVFDTSICNGIAGEAAPPDTFAGTSPPPDAYMPVR